MPSHLSPKKRLRRDKKKQHLNKSRISSLKTVVKKARFHPEERMTIVNAQKALAVAAKKGVIHPNTAARRTSRLMKLSFKAISS